MDRDAMIAKIEAIYAGRRTGDLSAFEEIFTPDAEFTFVGDESVIAAFPGGHSRDPNRVAQELFEQIAMESIERIETIVENRQIAVISKAVLRVGDNSPFEQWLFDLWEFDEDGRVVRGRQFQDTAKIIAELSH